MKVENVTPAELGHGYGNAYPLDVLGRWLEAMTLLKDKLQNDKNRLAKYPKIIHPNAGHQWTLITLHLTYLVADAKFRQPAKL